MGVFAIIFFGVSDFGVNYTEPRQDLNGGYRHPGPGPVYHLWTPIVLSASLTIVAVILRAGRQCAWGSQQYLALVPTAPLEIQKWEADVQRGEPGTCGWGDLLGIFLGLLESNLVVLFLLRRFLHFKKH
ncbi:hypothetical protein V8F33_004507 [Rhypophila sp. PSN 637]